MSTVLTLGFISSEAFSQTCVCLLTSSEYHCGPVRGFDRHSESKVALQKPGAEKGLCTELQAYSRLGGAGWGQTGATGLWRAKQQGARAEELSSE